jgi:hypothetical protein
MNDGAAASLPFWGVFYAQRKMHAKGKVEAKIF